MPRFQAALAGLLFAFSAQAETLYTVQLTPTPNPTVISSGGGVAKYDRVVSNQSGANLALSYRGLLTRADGAELPITGELALNLPPDGKSALTGLGFSVPYNYPAGNYSYSLYYREPGKPGYSKHSFGFSKSGTNPAPTPRVSVQLAPLAGTRLPLSGGTLTFSATLKNISTTTSETVQYWAILALPSGDRRVIAPVSSRSLTAGSSFKPMDLAVALSATDPNGDYLLTLYAISTNRSTPAVKQQVALSKEGERIDAMALADLNFDRCLKESAMQNGWQYIEEVVALDCRNRGIKVADGIELLTALTALDLSGNELRFFSNGVSSSSSPWTIQRLNLAGNRLEQFDLPQPWPALRELDLSGNRLRYLPLGFAASENLESLSLADNDLDNARELQGLLDDLPLLKKLDLSGIYLADTDILYWLGSLMLLEELDLSHTGLADPMLPVLPELKRLRLAGVPMLSTNRLQHLDQLTVLDLSGNGLIDLYGLQQLHLLEELRLSDNTGIPGYQVQMLLSGNPQLKQVALANLALEFDVVELLQNSGAASHIEELDLANSNQRPYSLPFPQLKRLNLSNNPLEFLPPLLAPDKLQELQLANTLLHDLSGFELFQALTVLDLSGLSSASPWQLETLLRQNPQLQQLSLRDWHIPTPLAGLLNQMPMEQSQLLKLDLSGAAVDIQGLALPRLKQLRLAGAVLRYPAPIDDYRFPLLRELDVADINMVPHVYGLPRDLDALNLSGQRWLQPYDITALIAEHPHLRELALRDVPSVAVLGNQYWLDSLQGSLQQLDLQNTGLTEARFNVPKLRGLNVSNNKLSALSLNAYQRLNKLVAANTNLFHIDGSFGYGPYWRWQLREADLSGNPELLVDRVRWFLQEHAGLDRLKLDGVNLAGVQLDAELASRERLQSLSVRNTGLRWQPGWFPALRHLALSGLTVDQLGAVPQLTALDLAGATLQFPDELYSMRRLQQLNLSGTAVTTELVQSVLRNNADLRQLRLAGVNLQDQPSMMLISASPTGLRGLTVLDVSNTGLRGMEALPLPNLRELAMAGVPLQGVPLYAQPLRRLDVASTQLVDLQLPMPELLQSLNLSGNANLDPFRVQDLLRQTPQLHTLGLADMPQLNLRELFQQSLPQPSSLQSLDIAGNHLTTLDGLQALPQLLSLNAARNELLELHPLWSLQLLQSVDLRGNTTLPCPEVDQYTSSHSAVALLRPEQCPAQP